MCYLLAIASYIPIHQRRTLLRKSEVQSPTRPNRPISKLCIKFWPRSPKLELWPLPYGENEIQWLNSFFLWVLKVAKFTCFYLETFLAFQMSTGYCLWMILGSLPVPLILKETAHQGFHVCTSGDISSRLRKYIHDTRSWHLSDARKTKSIKKLKAKNS